MDGDVRTVYAKDGTRLFLATGGRTFMSRSTALAFTRNGARDAADRAKASRLHASWVAKAEPRLRDGTAKSPHRAWVMGAESDRGRSLRAQPAGAEPSNLASALAEVASVQLSAEGSAAASVTAAAHAQEVRQLETSLRAAEDAAQEGAAAAKAAAREVEVNLQLQVLSLKAQLAGVMVQLEELREQTRKSVLVDKGTVTTPRARTPASPKALLGGARVARPASPPSTQPTSRGSTSPRRDRLALDAEAANASRTPARAARTAFPTSALSPRGILAAALSPTRAREAAHPASPRGPVKTAGAVPSPHAPPAREEHQLDEAPPARTWFD
jgi:hypothetical protein